MPDPVAITNLGNAAPLTGAERVPMDQDTGSVVNATALQVGAGYRIVALGNTNWTTAGVPAGVTAVVGLVFTCAAVGTGTGTAIQVETVDAPAQDIANLATATSVGLGPGSSPSFTGLMITGTAAVSIPHVHGDLAGKVYAHVRNSSGSPISALIPYHITGSHGDTDVSKIEPAQSGNALLMPAAGITYETLAPNGSSHGVVAGTITGVNTAGLTEGDALYVAAAGGLTATAPTSGIVQAVAIVGRVHASTGTLVVALGPAMAVVAKSGAYADLTGKPSIPAAADALPSALGTPAVGVSTDYAREDHVHQLPTIPAAADALPSALGIPAVGVSTDYAREDHAHQMPSAADVGAISSTTVRAANLVLAGPASGSPAPSTFRALVNADLPAVQYAPRVTISAVSSVYTLDAAATNEAVTGSAIAGNTTITASNLTGIPAGQVWRCVLRFAWTSGAITLSAPVGYTAKPPASLPTLVTGRTYKIIAECVGGESTLEWIYGNGDGYTT